MQVERVDTRGESRRGWNDGPHCSSEKRPPGGKCIRVSVRCSEQTLSAHSHALSGAAHKVTFNLKFLWNVKSLWLLIKKLHAADALAPMRWQATNSIA